MCPLKPPAGRTALVELLPLSVAELRDALLLDEAYIRSEEQVQNHPLRGALFETLVVNEFLKNRCNSGVREPLYFWRDNIGTEVDLILEQGNDLGAVEIKSGLTVASDAFGNLRKWQKYATERGNFNAIYPGLVYGGETRFTREGVDVLPWSAL